MSYTDERHFLPAVLVRAAGSYVSLGGTRFQAHRDPCLDAVIVLATAVDGRTHVATWSTPEMLDSPLTWAAELARYLDALWYPAEWRGRIGTRDRLESPDAQDETRRRRWHRLTSFRIGRRTRPKEPIRE